VKAKKGDHATNLVVQFTPVPEPGWVLGVMAAGTVIGRKWLKS
jgi:hypothetical protein